MATQAKAGSAAIEALYTETRTFAPPASFAAQANVRDRSIYDRAARDVEGPGGQR